MYDVITVGSSTVDMFAHTQFSEMVKIKTPTTTQELIAYPSGTKIIIDKLLQSIGGGGTNTAVAFSRLGLKTGYVGKIGKGSNGRDILECLKTEKIEFLGVKGECRSGYSVILDSLEHDRTILAFKGDNDNLDIKELNLRKIKAQWFYFSSMTGKSYDTLIELAKYANKNKIPFAYNPSNYQAKKGMEYLMPILSRAAAIIMNTEESELLTGMKKESDQIKELAKLGISYIAITDGKKGAVIYHEGYTYSAVPKKVKIIETTGAGDAFASSLIAGLAKKKPLETAIQYAFANATNVIMHTGSKNRLMTTRQMTAWLKTNSVKIKKKEICISIENLKYSFSNPDAYERN